MKTKKAVDPVYIVNRRLVKVRMVELGLNYDTLTALVSKLAQRQVSRSYLNHIVLDKRPGKHLLPYLAQALEISERKLLIKMSSPPTDHGGTQCAA